MNEMLMTAALAYARRGWHVLPTAGDKSPLTPRGFRAASVDPERIRRWWARWPRANVGIATGRPSGVLVLDIDPRHNGDQTLAALAATHGPLPATATVATGGGGQHYYFAVPSGRAVASRHNLWPGIDLKGDGGYVLAPPSRTAGPYRWLRPPDGPLAPAPDWLLARANGAPAGAPNPPGWVAAGLRDLRPGTRNTTLFRVAAWLRRTGASAEDVEALLAPHATQCGLPPTELRRLVTSACRYPPRGAASAGTLTIEVA